MEAFVHSGHSEAMIRLESPTTPRLSVRAIRLVSPDGTVSVLLTNLPEAAGFSAETLFGLYFRRWDVETHFRDEKTSMEIETFHSQTENGIRQALFVLVIMAVIARLLMRLTTDPEHPSRAKPQCKHVLISLAQEAAVLTPRDPILALSIFRELLDEMPRKTRRFEGIIITKLDRLTRSIYRISETRLWIYVSDITEKMRLNAIAEAVSTMNNLGYIFSGIRHELGNPVNSIKTTATVLKQNIDGYSKQTVLQYVDRMLSDLTRVEGLLRDLKNFSLYETLEVTGVELQAFMDHLVAMSRPDFDREHIRMPHHPAAGSRPGARRPAGVAAGHAQPVDQRRGRPAGPAGRGNRHQRAEARRPRHRQGPDFGRWE